MSQSGYTPILIYASGTASNVPLAANLSNGSSGAELAINYADGKLFYKDSSGVVQTLATKGTGPIGGSTTQVQYNLSGALAGSANLTFDGTTLTAAGLAGPFNGTVGATTPNTGAFTTLSASSTVTFNQSNASTSLAPTGTGTVTINPATAGTINNMSIGATTAASGKFSALTNTALTSGRVVYSTTAGLETDSANLTFDGTTLTANALTTTSTVTINGGTANGVAYLNGSKVLTTGSALTFDGTNLNVGGGPATYKVNVYGSGVSTYIGASDGTINAFYGVATGNAAAMGTTSAHPLWLYAGGSSRLTIASAGNVTINAPSSGNTLALAGTGTGILKLTDSSSTGYSGIAFAGTGTQNYAIGMGGPSEATFGVANKWFLYDGLAGAMRMVVDTSGNLGIGTATIGSRLTIGDPGTGAGFTNAAGGNLNIGLLAGTGSAVAYIYQRANAALLFGTNNAEVMRLDSSGNLGIGTSSPAYKLDVNGLIVTRGSSSGLAVTRRDTDALSWQWYSSAGNLQAYSQVLGGDVMTMTSGGNLGLGVTPSAWGSPFKALDMTASAFANEGTVAAHMTQNSYYNGTNWIYKATNLASRYLQYAGQHIWYTAPSGTAGNAITFTQAMTLDASGNVQIGTTSGSSRLTLYGNNSALQIFNSGGANQSDIDFPDAQTLRIRTYHASGSAIVFGTNPSGGGNTERARIDSSGNLLVGTTSITGARFVAVGTSSASSQVAIIRSNTASDTAYSAGLFAKYDNNSTTSQVFVRFSINQDASASGQINANGASQAAFGSWSDRRLKENIIDLPPQLANIMALRPVEFDYIESEGGGHQISFIAQEFEQIYPDAVGERADGMKTLTGWSKTEARLVKAIQEQQALIESLTARLNALENK